MTRSKKMMIAGAALTGLLAGASTMAFGSPAPVASEAGISARAAAAAKTVLGDAGHRAKPYDDDKDKHDCKGKNDCKGKGGCKANGDCKGKNDCKGKGGCATDK